MPYINVRDGQRLYVRVAGRGKPVILLHGLGMNSRHWLPFIWPYLHRYRFYMPDFRGAGRSARVTLNQTDVFQNHMEDIDDIARALSLHQVRLVGYSLGASTALHWQRHGGFSRVKRYLHVDQSPCVGNQHDWRHGLFGERQDDIFAGLSRLLDLLADHEHCQRMADLPLAQRQQALALLADTLGDMTGKHSLRPLLLAAARWPRVLDLLLPIKRLDDMRAYLAAYTAGGHDYRQSLQGSPTPVTVLVGMQSPLYHPAGQMHIANSVRHGHIVRFHQSGHAPLIDEPVKFAQALGEFLRGHPA